MPQGDNDWFSNDDLFKNELTEGHTWARRVAGRLRNNGLTVVQHEMEWRESIQHRGRFASEEDLTVQLPSGRFQIECKSRRLEFTDDPETYPYATALVDTVSGWDQKQEAPRAVVLVSQLTGAMIAISVLETRADWRVTKKFDRVRQIHDQWYEVTRSRLRRFHDLVNYLHGEVARP